MENKTYDDTCKLCYGNINTCPMEHEAHAKTVEQAHKLAVESVNSLVCKKIITMKEWQKYYLIKFEESYNLIYNNILITINDFHNKKSSVVGTNITKT